MNECMNDFYFLIEDGKIKSTFLTEQEALDAMAAEHKRDVFGMLAKRRVLNLFLRGKYKLKEYAVVRALSIKTIDSDDATLGGIF